MGGTFEGIIVCGNDFNATHFPKLMLKSVFLNSFKNLLWLSLLIQKLNSIALQGHFKH